MLGFSVCWHAQAGRFDCWLGLAAELDFAFDFGFVLLTWTSLVAAEKRRASGPAGRAADSAIAFLLTFSAAIVITNGKAHQSAEGRRRNRF